MNTHKQKEPLSLTRQFAAAALGVAAGIGAAYGVNALVMEPLGAASSVAAFFTNFGALFATAGAVTAAAEHKLRPPAPRP